MEEVEEASQGATQHPQHDLYHLEGDEEPEDVAPRLLGPGATSGVNSWNHERERGGGQGEGEQPTLGQAEGEGGSGLHFVGL